MFISLIVLIVIALIFYVATLLMGEEEDSMSKLRNVYLYLVSFVTLMMILGGIIFTVQNITDVMFPTNYYNEPIAAEKMGNLSTEDREAIKENQKIMQGNQRTESKKSVFKSITVVVVALPTFIYHWRKIEAEKNA